LAAFAFCILLKKKLYCGWKTAHPRTGDPRIGRMELDGTGYETVITDTSVYARKIRRSR
jgi:hypothetical protein